MAGRPPGLTWSKDAREALRKIADYLDSFSPRAAQETVLRILARAEQGLDYPDSGRIVPELADSDTREFIEGTYRIVYRRGKEAVTVVAVFDARMPIPGDLS
ncbi:MAG: type II toxin-antitoxin system RelE/ParE family toxin [Candidatus Sericytochromatia bacterium]|nr:type II toxin-antitoxin system RelE/ParE family toxin [Candidatus Tanganyikabacteria bacterium]